LTARKQIGSLQVLFKFTIVENDLFEQYALEGLIENDVISCRRKHVIRLAQIKRPRLTKTRATKTKKTITIKKIQLLEEEGVTKEVEKLEEVEETPKRKHKQKLILPKQLKKPRRNPKSPNRSNIPIMGFEMKVMES